MLPDAWRPSQINRISGAKPSISTPTAAPDRSEAGFCEATSSRGSQANPRSHTRPATTTSIDAQTSALRQCFRTPGGRHRLNGSPAAKPSISYATGGDHVDRRAGLRIEAMLPDAWRPTWFDGTDPPTAVKPSRASQANPRSQHLHHGSHQYFAYVDGRGFDLKINCIAAVIWNYRNHEKFVACFLNIYVI